jgi:acetyl esterase/lipase
VSRASRSIVVTALLLALLGAGCSDGGRPAAGAAAASSTTPAPPSGTAGTESAATAAAPSALGSAETVIPAGSCRLGVCTTTELASWRAVPFTSKVPCGHSQTCRLLMDVLAPTSGGPHPLVVVLAGGPNAPDDQGYANSVAFPLAAKGSVVLRASWRQGAEYGGGWPASLRDVACAVGVARRLGPGYGGAPGHVTLVGHSLGGWVGAVAGLTPRPFTPRPGDCLKTAGSLRPDAVVTLAGAVDEIRNQGMGAPFLNAFFGGTQRQRPKAWAAADPFALADRPAGRRAVPFTVVTGGQDTVITASAGPRLNQALRRSGYESRLVRAPAADHDGVLEAPRAIRAILAAGPAQ